MIFLGWLIAAFCVVGVINLYLKSSGQSSRKLSNLSSSNAESINWINVFLYWLRVVFKPSDILDRFVKAVNEQARKSNVRPYAFLLSPVFFHIQFSEASLGKQVPPEDS